MTLPDFTTAETLSSFTLLAIAWENEARHQGTRIAVHLEGLLLMHQSEKCFLLDLEHLQYLLIL